MNKLVLLSKILHTHKQSYNQTHNASLPYGGERGHVEDVLTELLVDAATHVHVHDIPGVQQVHAGPIDVGRRQVEQGQIWVLNTVLLLHLLLDDESNGLCCDILECQFQLLL